jgi:hypothetical protein
MAGLILVMGLTIQLNGLRILHSLEIKNEIFVTHFLINGA